MNTHTGSRLRRAAVLTCVIALVGASWASLPARASTADAGTCVLTVQETWSPNLTTTPTRGILWSIQSVSGLTCAAPFTNFINFIGGGTAILASCEDINDLSGTVNFETADAGIGGYDTGQLVPVSVSGTLFAQQWEFVGANPTQFDATATLAVASPTAQLSLCEGSGVNVVDATGTITFVDTSTFI